MKYVRDSINKFKKDALSKGIHDFVMWLIFTELLLTIGKWTPFFEDLLLFKIELKIYWFVTIIIGVILFTIILVSWYYRKRISKVRIDNQTDELTGLKNQRALKEHLTKELENTKEKPLSLILLDIDSFKEFNTKYGYQIADKILKKLGELLGNDKRVTDETFRVFYKGDEFMIVTKKTNQDQAFQASERKRSLIQNASFEIEDNFYNLTVSCGVTEYKSNDSFETIMKRANDALKLAKSNPDKNCTKVVL